MSRGKIIPTRKKNLMPRGSHVFSRRHRRLECPPAQPVVKTKNGVLCRTKAQLDYLIYLQSEHWQTLRRQALAAAHYRCSVCGSSTLLNVHHLHYRTLGHEALTDLTVLCETCHAAVHAIPAVASTVLAGT